MADETPGRMLNRKISRSKAFASLSPEAGVLHNMVIPHLNSHGKTYGGPAFMKEVICPLVPYLTIENIPKLMREVSKKTRMKWFEWEGQWWIHALDFNLEEQKLRPDRIGKDRLPSFQVEVAEPAPIGDREEAPAGGSSGAPPSPDSPTEKDFEAIWKRYPDKDGKKESWKHFKASVKTAQDLASINLALDRYLKLKADRIRAGYAKKGSTWFNNWKDWIEYDDHPDEQKAEEKKKDDEAKKKAEAEEKERNRAADEAYRATIAEIGKLPPEERAEIQKEADRRASSLKIGGKPLSSSLRRQISQQEMVELYRERVNK